MALLLTLCSVILLAVVKSEFPIDSEFLDSNSWRNEDDLTYYRIPEVLDPIHYDIEITPYFEAEPEKEAFTFDGIVEITVRAVEDNISRLVIQENVRKIVNVSVTDLNGTAILLNEDNEYDRDQTHQYLIINLQDGLTLTRDEHYLIRIEYVGNINETPLSRGVFRGSYKDSEGNTRWYAATHLQPTHSRQAFPSFDEPGFKSTFNITVNRLTSFTSTYSNMHIAYNETVGRRTKEVFMTTPKMSAYLVTLHISEEYAVIADNHDEDRSYRILARPNADGQGEYALDIGIKLTEQLEEFLGIPYYEMGEQMKNDQIASPDWASGATENWGLVSYRELRLLYEEGETNVVDRVSIGTITAHELAHKWFGNLVTARWWDNVWINEGFASYFEYFSMHEVEPLSQFDDQFNIMYLHSGLSADSAANTRALQHEVNSPAQVTGHFSGISYSKGASLLMMLNHFLTPEVFRKALNYFLLDRAYDYALPEHLYAAFEAVLADEELPENFSNLNITSFLSTWVNEPGYPLLTVGVDREEGVLKLRQDRFFNNPTETSTDQIWPLPLTYTTSNNPNWNNRRASDLMTLREQTIEATIAEDEWVIFNIKQNGIYRVHYDEHNWELIANTLQNSPGDIDYLNRAQIVDDVFALMRSEKISFLLGFKLLDFLKEETNFFVWYPAISGFSWLRNRFLHIPRAISEYDNILHQYLDKIIADLTYDVTPDEGLIRTMNRFYIMSFACTIGHKGCVDDAVEKFNQYYNNDASINPNIRRHVYCSGLLAGGNSEWQKLYQRRLDSNNQADEVVMLRALGCTQDPTAIQSYLDMILSPDVRGQDRVNAFTFLFMGHRDNSKFALQFIKENHNLIRERVFGSNWFSNIINNLASYLDADGLNDMEEWLHENEDSFLEYSVGINAVQLARDNMAWGDRQWEEVLRGARGAGHLILPTIFVMLPALLAIMLR